MGFEIGLPKKGVLKWKGWAEVPFSQGDRMFDNLPSMAAISILSCRTSRLCVAFWRPGMLEVILKEHCLHGLPGNWLWGWGWDTDCPGPQRMGRAGCLVSEQVVILCGDAAVFFLVNNQPEEALLPDPHEYTYTKQGVTWWWDTTDYFSSPDLYPLLLLRSLYLDSLLSPHFSSKALEKQCSQTIWVCMMLFHLLWGQIA